MPYNKRQIDRILNHDGEPIIPLNSAMGLAARITESYIRRRIYRIEDITVLKQFHHLKQAFVDIRNHALDLAQRSRMDTLGINAEGILWRRDLDRYIATRLNLLSGELAGHTLRKAGEIYLYSYLGRAWSMDMATRPEIKINKSLPSFYQVTADVVQPAMEAFQPSVAAYELLGVEWQQQYADTLNDGARRIRNQLQIALGQGESVLAGVNRVGDVLGVNDGTSGVAGRLGTITRSNVQRASVSGVTAIANENTDVLWGFRYVTARDSKVCPICAPLDGAMWSLEMLHEVVYPVQDTHPNCRCNLYPITTDAVANPADTPPPLTWEEWLRVNSLDDFFSEEFAGDAFVQ